MKYYDTHYEEYIESVKTHNIHPELTGFFENFPSTIKELGNLIVYGPCGSGKYSQVLYFLQKYSPTRLKYDKRITLNTEKQSYIYRMSDIHYEIDMGLLGCHSKVLWHELFFQIVDIISMKTEKTGIFVCKNFHMIHSELLEVFYSYIQQSAKLMPSMYIRFVLITEHISFIPNPILCCCEKIAIRKPSKQDYLNILLPKEPAKTHSREQKLRASSPGSVGVSANAITQDLDVLSFDGKPSSENTVNNNVKMGGLIIERLSKGLPPKVSLSHEDKSSSLSNPRTPTLAPRPLLREDVLAIRDGDTEDEDEDTPPEIEKILGKHELFIQKIGGLLSFDGKPLSNEDKSSLEHLDGVVRRHPNHRKITPPSDFSRGFCSRESYKRVKKTIDEIAEQNVLNLKELQLLTQVETEELPKDIFNIICDNIIHEITNSHTLVFTQFRENLYDILIYNLDITECVWYILSHFIRIGSITNATEILPNIYTFLKYYNNNYRPIYHLESIFFYLLLEVRKQQPVNEHERKTRISNTRTTRNEFVRQYKRNPRKV